MNAVQHDLAAQRAAEVAYEELVDQEEGDCTCTTCVVRVILEAAWPNLLEAAREETTTGVTADEVFEGSADTCDSGADIISINRARKR